MVLAIRYIFLIPLVLALVSFVLTSLALFAGQKQGFMEDYAIARLNMTGLPIHILHSVLDDKKENQTSDDKLDRIRGWVDQRSKAAVEKLKDISGNVLDRLKVPDWYSLHIMDTCKGQFKTDPPGLNTTHCTTSSPAHGLNLTRVLSQDGFDPVLKGFGLEGTLSSLQAKVDIINDALLALFIVYVLCMGFSGLSILLSVGALLLPAGKVLVVAALGVASVGALTCLIGSVITSIIGSKAVHMFNEMSSSFGIQVELGSKFRSISWAATALMLAITAFWLVSLWMIRGKARRGDKEGI